VKFSTECSTASADDLAQSKSVRWTVAQRLVGFLSHARPRTTPESIAPARRAAQPEWKCSTAPEVLGALGPNSPFASRFIPLRLCVKRWLIHAFDFASLSCLTVENGGHPRRSSKGTPCPNLMKSLWFVHPSPLAMLSSPSPLWRPLWRRGAESDESSPFPALPKPPCTRCVLARPQRW
jgi:hypothetical protein